MSYIIKWKNEKEYKEDIYNQLYAAMEWGFRAHEKGFNLEEAINQFKKVHNE